MNTNTATPSLFCTLPMSSILKKSEAETVARNIMAILKRTGDTFRNLDWEEYKEERQKDGQFTEGEYHYFMQVIEYCLNAETAKLFSPVWKQAYNKFREENPNNTDNTPASKGVDNKKPRKKGVNKLVSEALTIHIPKLQSENKRLKASHALLLEALRKIEMKSWHKNEWADMEEINQLAKAAIAAAEKQD